MYRKGKPFLSGVLLIIFSFQLLLSVKIATSRTVGTYHPNGYNILGATTYISGALTHLQSDDSVYMAFRSYFSGTDTSDFVDNDASDVDSSADKGTHSNFSAQQAGPDGQYEVLIEQNTGGVGTLIIRPNAAGKKTEWTPYGATNNYDCVDEATPDEDTTFVNTTTKSKKDFYNLQNHTTEEGSISNVRLYVRAKGNVGAELTLRLVVDLTEYQGQTHTLTTSYANYYDDWATNPATLANWTWSDIDALEAGFMSSTSAAVEHRVTQLYVEVAYTGDSYELDLEVQWTNVDYDEANEYLCIYAGSMETENLRVDYWMGSSWSNLFTDLTANSWNNVSVSLTSTTFTIRFKDGTETGDTMQDFWNIDVTLLHVWTDQYTSEVEFTGSSNTYTWTQLIWTVDSAWTTGSASVTLQLYNYSLGDYPRSGNGYMSYTSSATANTDETKSQTITVNPTHFRNSTGYWKVKVKGIKITDTPFDLKADLIKYDIQTPSQPFGWVTTIFYALPVFFGLLFLLTAKLKRKKKKTDRFSESFGMTHQQIIGKKMLLEIDPTSDYYKVLFKFASEARNSSEPLFIFTSINSALHSALSEAENLKFYLLTSNTSSFEQISEKEILLPAHDLSVLLNASLEILKVQKEKTVNMLFDNLSSIIIRCGFKKTYSFMHFLLEAISSPRATALFVFNPAAHDPVISSSIRGLFQNQLAYTKRGPKVETL